MARRSDHSRDELYRLALDAAGAITAREGLRGLKARQIVRDMGYTIGTLYNLFDDLDDVIVHMNGETLDALHDACASAPRTGRPERDLRALAKRYLAFTRTHPNLWNAIFEHKLPDGRALPDWYLAKIARLRKLEEDALAPMFADRDQARDLQHHAMVMWTSLFGMAAIESAQRLPAGESADSLVDSLISIYLKGLVHGQGDKPGRRARAG